MNAGHLNNGWKTPENQWIAAPDVNWPCNAYKNRTHFEPCLFDLEADPREKHNLGPKMQKLVQDMWEELNKTNLAKFKSRSPAHLIGVCNSKCAKKKWAELGPGPGPTCDVPGCTGDGEEALVV